MALRFVVTLVMLLFTSGYVKAGGADTLVYSPPVYRVGDEAPVMGVVLVILGTEVYAEVSAIVTASEPNGDVTVSVLATGAGFAPVGGHTRFNHRNGTFMVDVPFMGLQQQGSSTLRFPIREGDRFDFFNAQGVRTDSCYVVRRLQRDEPQRFPGASYAYTCTILIGQEGRTVTYYMDREWKWLVGFE